jgi:hypothetical protein
MTASGSSSTQHPIDELSPHAENFLDLLEVFSHDCRNDLVSMGAALVLVQKGVYGTLSEEAKEELQKDLFTKSNGSGSCAHREQQGLGIGLSLVKKIVESHGGRIWYRAETNASHFLFSLPASREPH